jgi:hypothetical protein
MFLILNPGIDSKVKLFLSELVDIDAHPTHRAALVEALNKTVLARPFEDFPRGTFASYGAC